MIQHGSFQIHGPHILGFDESEGMAVNIGFILMLSCRLWVLDAGYWAESLAR